MTVSCTTLEETLSKAAVKYCEVGEAERDVVYNRVRASLAHEDIRLGTQIECPGDEG